MPAPSSSLLLLITFAASLPARLGAAWLAFTSYDTGAGPAPDAAPPEPMTSCHSSGTTDEGAAPVEEAAAEPDAKTGEEVMAEAPAEEVPGLTISFDRAEAAILEANAAENVSWIVEIDTQEWRQSPWRSKLVSMFNAAGRGVVITSVCSGRSVPRDAEAVQRAVSLLVHEMNHPLAFCSDTPSEAANGFVN